MAVSGRSVSRAGQGHPARGQIEDVVTTRRLGFRERLYHWLALKLERRADRLGERAWQKAEREPEQHPRRPW